MNFVKIATTFAEVESMRDVWERMSVSDINADIDYFLTIARTAKHVVSPYVVHIRCDGRDLMAICRIEDVLLPCKLGYLTLARPSLRGLAVVFGGLLGALSEADEEMLITQLKEPLRTGTADVLILRDLASDSSMLASLSRMSWIRRSHGEGMSSRWMVSLPETLDGLLSRRSTKTKQRLRGQERKLIKDYGDRLRMRRFDKREDFAELCRDMERVAAQSYQAGLGAGFTNSPTERGLLKLMLPRGWHRTWMIYVDDLPVAFWTGTRYAKTFTTGTPGFDPQYSRDSVGHFAMMRMFEDLCADPEVSSLDFGHGEAGYKAAFGQCVRQETNLFIFSRRPAAIAVNLVFSTLSIINGHAARLARETTWGQQFKKAWRYRVTPRKDGDSRLAANARGDRNFTKTKNRLGA